LTRTAQARLRRDQRPSSPRPLLGRSRCSDTGVRSARTVLAPERGSGRA
jgi:hypothetical protein